MVFAEALQDVMHHKCIRRASWPPDRYVFLRVSISVDGLLEQELLFVLPQPVSAPGGASQDDETVTLPYCPSDADAQAEDWELHARTYVEINVERYAN